MLTITDKVFTPGAAGLVPAVGQAVLISASVVPTLVSSGGKYYDLLSQNQRVVTDANGQWSVQLPWPSELDPNTSVTWLIRLPDGVTFGGTVPEGVVGPLTIRELKNSYSWAIVVGGATQAVTVVGTGIPAQAGHVGQFLQTDGTNVSWAPAAGGGTVTSVGTGTGLTGGPITGSGTVSLANTAVTPGSYTNSSITVDQQGRLTAAASGAAPALASTTISAGTGLSGGGDLSTNRTFALANTSVTPGSYTSTNLTVDAQGRITAASNGSAGGSTGNWTWIGDYAKFANSPSGFEDVNGNAILKLQFGSFNQTILQIWDTQNLIALDTLTFQGSNILFQGPVGGPASILPSGDNSGAGIGKSDQQWSTLWSYLHATKNGGAIASASTISPTAGIHHITGTTQITTINVPVSAFVGAITLIPDAAFTTGTSGNIAIASTAVVGKALIMTYDGTKWYPSY